MPLMEPDVEERAGMEGGAGAGVEVWHRRRPLAGLGTQAWRSARHPEVEDEEDAASVRSTEVEEDAAACV
jgi:hypothetical protein